MPLQIAYAAISKLKKAINFRQWTARGKGLVLLNILVSSWLQVDVWKAEILQFRLRCMCLTGATAAAL